MRKGHPFRDGPVPCLGWGREAVHSANSHCVGALKRESFLERRRATCLIAVDSSEHGGKCKCLGEQP